MPAIPFKIATSPCMEAKALRVSGLFMPSESAIPPQRVVVQVGNSTEFEWVAENPVPSKHFDARVFEGAELEQLLASANGNFIHGTVEIFEGSDGGQPTSARKIPQGSDVDDTEVVSTEKTAVIVNWIQIQDPPT